MDIARPPLVGDLPTEVLTGMVEGDTRLGDADVTEARTWFMIKTPL